MSADPIDDPLILSGQICFAAYSTVHAFAAVYRPLLAPLGLTYPQYLVMLVLWQRGRLGIGDLGHQLQLDSGTLTPLVKRLEAMGLVRRSRAAGDERRVDVSLTDGGEALRERAADIPRRMLEAMGGDVEEVRRLREALQTMRTRLRAAVADDEAV